MGHSPFSNSGRERRLRHQIHQRHGIHCLLLDLGLHPGYGTEGSSHFNEIWQTLFCLRPCTPTLGHVCHLTCTWQKLFNWDQFGKHTNIPVCVSLEKWRVAWCSLAPLKSETVPPLQETHYNVSVMSQQTFIPPTAEKLGSLYWI